MKRIYVVGTMDTKAEELRYVQSLIQSTGARSILADVSTRAYAGEVDVTAREIAAFHPQGADAIVGNHDRGDAVTAMSEAFRRYVLSRKDVAGMIGLGGSGGSAIISAGMQALPVGVPKLLVSTLAATHAGPYIGATDVTLMYPVTDIAGLNRISRVVLGNAAHAIAGMARHEAPTLSSRPSIGLTMFGVTTACVTAVTKALHSEYDCLVFHATGTGGQSMEKLVDSGFLDGVIDVTTTEICDLIVGGVLSAGPERLDAIARTGIPYVGSCGALDMVNFWAPETIPQAFRQRLFHRHNPQVTLMRTSVDECARIGSWIGEKLNACHGPVRFLLPEKGVSALDAPGEVFHDPEADAALFAALENSIQQTPQRHLVRLPLHINDPQFADVLRDHFLEIRQSMKKKPTDAGH
jgi:uncharacterized protein (UPF0261 family)